MTRPQVNVKSTHTALSPLEAFIEGPGDSVIEFCKHRIPLFDTNNTKSESFEIERWIIKKLKSQGRYLGSVWSYDAFPSYVQINILLEGITTDGSKIGIQVTYDNQDFDVMVNGILIYFDSEKIRSIRDAA